MKSSKSRLLFWIVGLSISGFGLYNLVFHPSWIIFYNLLVLVIGLLALPPLNNGMLNKLNLELPDRHIIIFPILAVLIVVATSPDDSLYYEDFTKEELSQESANLSDIGHSEIMRSYSTYQNDIIYYEGEIQDIQSTREGYMMLVATGYRSGGRYTTGGFSGDLVWTDYNIDQGEIEADSDRPVEGDVIEVYGEYLGPREYETAIGSVNTVPSMALWHAEIAG